MLGPWEGGLGVDDVKSFLKPESTNCLNAFPLVDACSQKSLHHLAGDPEVAVWMRAQPLYLGLPEKCETPLVMLMAKRISLEIMAEILSLCKKPQTKTKVMYGTNLSWKMLQKYLSQLQSLGLLEAHHSSTKYATTEKGLKFVEKWRELENFSNSVRFNGNPSRP